MATRLTIGQRKRANILAKVEQLNLEDVLLADGLDHAIIGLVDFPWTIGEHVVVAYSIQAILEGLVADGMSLDEAREYFDYNIKGAFVGTATPIYVQDELDFSDCVDDVQEA